MTEYVETVLVAVLKEAVERIAKKVASGRRLTDGEITILILDQMIKRIDAKFDSINAGFDSVDARLSSIEDRISSLEKRINDRVDGLEKRTDACS